MESYNKETKKDDKKQKEPAPDVCKGCLKWDKFGKNCNIYWEGKKYCTRKVLTMEEWAKKEILV